MLKLPRFLLNDDVFTYKNQTANDIDLTQIIDSLHLSGYFINKWLFNSEHEQRFILERNKLINTINEETTIA